MHNTVVWAPGTPFGYTANLLVGYSFEGNGAATYENHPLWSGETITGTLVIRTYSPFMGSDYPDFWTTRSHVFTATYVPEPASALVIGVLLLPMGRVMSVRRRRS